MAERFSEGQQVVIAPGSTHNARVIINKWGIRRQDNTVVPRPATFVRYMAGDEFAIVTVSIKPNYSWQRDSQDVRVMVEDLSTS